MDMKQDKQSSMNLSRRAFVAGSAAASFVALAPRTVFGFEANSRIKAGIIAATKSMALALAPYHVAVNAVGPGLTDTDQPRDGLSEEEIAERSARNPWGRMAQPEDIARAVLYLASDLSDYVTGQTLFVNGGWLMVP